MVLGKPRWDMLEHLVNVIGLFKKHTSAKQMVTWTIPIWFRVILLEPDWQCLFVSPREGFRVYRDYPFLRLALNSKCGEIVI